MRACLWIGLAVCLLAWPAGAASAGEQEDIKALVEDAIAARGGEAALKGVKAAVWRSEGKTPTRTSRAALYGQLPGKFRLESERTENGRTTLYVKIINGDKGWVLEGTKARPMTREEMAEVKQTFYHKNLDATLLPLRDRDVRLSLLNESKVEGKAALGLKVSRKGMPDVHMYFDRQTKLLLKSEREVKDKATGKPARLELLYSDYEDVGGFKLARRTRRVVGGKPVGDVRITDFELRPGLDDRLFLPPGEGTRAQKP